MILGNVGEGSNYLSFGTCNEVDIKQLCSSSIHKYSKYYHA